MSRPTIVRRYFLISARHVGFRDGHGNGGDRNLRQDVQKRKNKKTEKPKKAKNTKKQKMPKRQKRLFLCGNYLDYVAVFEFVTLFDAHLCLCIDCVEETLSDIGVDLICEIVRG